jgi:hypothetical protein
MWYYGLALVVSQPSMKTWRLGSPSPRLAFLNVDFLALHYDSLVIFLLLLIFLRSCHGLVPGHTGIAGNERADQLARKAASEKRKGRTSIAWLKERISQHYSTAKDTEVDKGKHAIIPPAPKKSFLDSAPNRLSRTIAQIRTGHWRAHPT